MVGLVFIGNIEYCPYLEKYENILEELKLEYEVLFWNRDGEKKQYPDSYVYFNKKSHLKINKFYKLNGFLQYSIWLKNKIRKRRYSKLIILDTLSGIILSDVLLNIYSKNYIFDIRDYSYEKVPFFLAIEEKIIKKSYFTCISSDGFKDFLPKGYNYITTHNFSYSDLSIKKKELSKKKKYGDTLDFVWIGSIRFFNHQVEIINKLKNDDRFNIIYHGIGPDYDALKEYCSNNCIDNVKFTGLYVNSDRPKLLLNVDILNNSYGTQDEMQTKYLISNRYYDGLIFKIPQLVEINSYKNTKIKEAGVGIGIDIYSDKFNDDLYKYYFEIDEKSFNEGCNAELNKIIKEDKIYINKIEQFLM